MLYELGKCKRCGGTVVNDEVPTVGFPDVEVAYCLKCGERYYRGFPKREGSTHATCTVCGKIFKRRKDKNITICAACRKSEDRIIYCVSCGAPIHKGFVCTKKKCQRAKKELKELSL